MTTTTDLKRQNFNVTPEQESELLTLQGELHAPSVKDAILAAARIALFLAHEAKNGRRLSLRDRHGNVTEIVLPELEPIVDPPWKYLVERPHSWRRQLFVKGRRLMAAQVWIDTQTNSLTREEAAENWNLPIEAIDEIEVYCTQNIALIRMESDEERIYLEGHGIRLTA